MFSFIALLLYVIGLSAAELKQLIRKRKLSKQLIDDLYWSGCAYF